MKTQRLEMYVFIAFRMKIRKFAQCEGSCFLFSAASGQDNKMPFHSMTEGPVNLCVHLLLFIQQNISIGFN